MDLTTTYLGLTLKSPLVVGGRRAVDRRPQQHSLAGGLGGSGDRAALAV